MRLAVVAFILFSFAVVPAAASATTLVRYDRTGGFAGVQDRVTVSTRGVVRVRTRAGADRFRLSERRLRALRRAVRDAHFATLQRRYAPATPVYDGYVEAVAHGGRTVTVAQGGDPPARLRRLLTRLRALLP